jgi:hypothetical protein
MDGPLGLKEIEDPKLSRESTHNGGKVVSLMHLDSILKTTNLSLSYFDVCIHHILLQPCNIERCM